MRKLILKHFLSPGDIVMLTAAVRDLHECYPNRFLTDVRTSCSQLWENNSYLTPLDENDRKVEVIECHYPLINQSNQAPYHCLHGFIEFLNAYLKLQIKPTAFKGDIHLSDLEKSWYSQVHEQTGEDTPFWIIVAGGKYDVTIKWWSAARYQEVVDHFRGKIQFVQVGDLEHYHPSLRGVIDLRGQTDLRQLVRLVYHAQGILCPVTCLMHLAAAVKVKPGNPSPRPCVVVAGSREPSHWEAYPGHQFIHMLGALPCGEGGCWKSRTIPLGDGDDRDKPENLCVDVVGDLPRCMDMITSAEVIRRLETYFDGAVAPYLSSAQFQAAQRAVSDSFPQPMGQGRTSRTVRIPAVFDQVLPRVGKFRNGQGKDLTLVTLHDQKMAAVAKVTSRRLRQYAEHHGYKLVQYDSLLDPSRHPAWNKILAVRHALLSRQSEWVMWIDADAIIMNLRTHATDLIPEDRDMVFATDFNGLNSGVFLVRYCDWSLKFLDTVYFLGDVNYDPDGFGAKWEQNTIKHLLEHFDDSAAHVAMLPQDRMNSSWDSFKKGNFLLHLGGISNDERLKTLRQAQRLVVT